MPESLSHAMDKVSTRNVPTGPGAADLWIFPVVRSRMPEIGGEKASDLWIPPDKLCTKRDCSPSRSGELRNI